MTLSYLSPVNEMRDQFRRLFNDVSDFNEESRFPTAFRSNWMTGDVGDWSPAIEVSETDDEVCVCAALPGIKPDEINVEVSGNTLVLSGETRRTFKTDERQCHRSEFQYGEFMRRITLPDYAQGDDCTAEYHDGVLEVHIPKSENTMHKRIEIKAS